MVTPRRIGLDLDNTVIDYAPAYRAVAKEMGLPQQLVDRESIRESLRKSEEDDEEWQRFQALLYTDGLAYAQPAPGLLEFLSMCDSIGVSVVIISHKTETTPERFGSRDLRVPAFEWLDTQGIVPKYIQPDGVFFCADRAEKLRTIVAARCDVFVDDLIEVLEDADMPIGITRFHYQVGANSISAKPESIVDADFLSLTSWLRSC